MTGPYEGERQPFSRIMRAPLERNMSDMTLLARVKPPGSNGWRLSAWRGGEFWEWRKRVHGGIDSRLVARIVSSNED